MVFRLDLKNIDLLSIKPSLIYQPDVYDVLKRVESLIILIRILLTRQIKDEEFINYIRHYIKVEIEELKRSPVLKLVGGKLSKLVEKVLLVVQQVLNNPESVKINEIEDLEIKLKRITLPPLLYYSMM